MTAPMASTTMDLPAPVSPVRALKPRVESEYPPTRSPQYFQCGAEKARRHPSLSRTSLQHLVDLVTEGRCFLIVPHDQQGRYRLPPRLPTRSLISMPSMAAQAAEARPGMRLEHHNILGAVKGGDSLLENGPQPSGEIQRGLAAGHHILVGAVAGELLDQMQLLDVPGNGGLGRAYPSLP